MNTQESFEERRRERRFPINSKVQMTPDSGDPVIGICINISGSGLLIKSEKPLTVGSTIQIEIKEGKIDFQADAEVVRVNEIDGDFQIALKVSKQLN